jgi:hypothetical protein
MNKFCEECFHNSTTGCILTSIPNCKVVENKTRLKELELAKPYLNSDYYWRRYKELKGEENDKL